MELLVFLLALVLGFLGGLLVLGLYSPWRVLWWKEKQNRLMVLSIYGLPFVLLFFLRLILLYA